MELVVVRKLLVLDNKLNNSSLKTLLKYKLTKHGRPWLYTEMDTAIDRQKLIIAVSLDENVDLELY
jgi:hypothetical protein